MDTFDSFELNIKKAICLYEEEGKLYRGYKDTIIVFNCDMYDGIYLESEKMTMVDFKSLVITAIFKKNDPVKKIEKIDNLFVGLSINIWDVCFTIKRAYYYKYGFVDTISKKSGTVFSISENGDIFYTTEYIYGRKNGKEYSNLKNPFRPLYIKEFKNNVLHGKCEIFNCVFPYIVTEFKNGLLDGELKNFVNAKGQMSMRITMKDGKINGLYEEWTENTNELTKRATFIDGNCHGTLMTWHDGGEKNMKCSYNYGKKHGIFKKWNYNGDLKYSVNYKNDVKHGQWLLYENGTVFLSENYVEGNLDGERNKYKIRKDNVAWLYKKNNYLRGEYHKTQYKWHSTGEIMRIVNYENGIKHGFEYLYTNDGKLLTRKKYDNGVLISEDGPIEEKAFEILKTTVLSKETENKQFYKSYCQYYPHELDINKFYKFCNYYVLSYKFEISDSVEHIFEKIKEIKDDIEYVNEYVVFNH